MKFFNLFKKKQVTEIEPKKMALTKPIDYRGLLDITRILTEEDSESIGTVSLLLTNPRAFQEKFDNWLIDYDFSPGIQPDIITAYLLTGNNVDSPHDYGGYIDWKDEGSEIIWSLKPGMVNKNYPISLDEIHFPNDECGEDALQIISLFLTDTEYRLINWDIGGDCYNLFIVPRNKWTIIKKIGSDMNINFYAL